MIAAECGEEKGCPEYLCRMHAAEAEVYQAVLEKWKSGCGDAEDFPFFSDTCRMSGIWQKSVRNTRKKCQKHKKDLTSFNVMIDWSGEWK